MESDDQKMADALEISVNQLAELRRRLEAAKKNLAGPSAQCRQLGVAPNELNGLQKVLANSGEGFNGVVRGTINTILRDRSRRANSDVFVVDGSAVYHRTAGCEFIRNAKLRQMSAAKATSKGLRVCEHCKTEADIALLAPVQETSAFAEAPDALPAPKKANKSRKSPKKGKNRTKRQRDSAEATQLGISVDDLKQQRRAEAARDYRLSERAKAMGVTTKRLRKLIEKGDEPPEA